MHSTVLMHSTELESTLSTLEVLGGVAGAVVCEAAGARHRSCSEVGGQPCGNPAAGINQQAHERLGIMVLEADTHISRT
jgi:hypothetical protein